MCSSEDTHVICDAIILHARCAARTRSLQQPTTHSHRDGRGLGAVHGRLVCHRQYSNIYETDAYNAMESYRLAGDGTVATTFSFREGGFEGARKTYHPTGYIIDRQSNAVWGMQFIWPIKADYRIVFVDESYSQTVIGRTARDYVWLMARTPEISDPDYQRFLTLIAQEGYDVSKVRKVPQQIKE